MKQHTTNNALFQMFKNENCSQIEFSYLIDSNKNSINDWLANKNEMKFSKLEQFAKELGKKITIKIE